MCDLSGQQIETFRIGLLKLFPTRSKFEIFLKEKLNKELNHITPENADLTKCCYDVISEAEAVGGVKDLADTVYKYDPKNFEIAQVAEHLGVFEAMAQETLVRFGSFKNSRLQERATARAIALCFKDGHLLVPRFVLVEADRNADGQSNTVSLSWDQITSLGDVGDKTNAIIRWDGGDKGSVAILAGSFSQPRNAKSFQELVASSAPEPGDRWLGASFRRSGDRPANCVPEIDLKGTVRDKSESGDRLFLRVERQRNDVRWDECALGAPIFVGGFLAGFIIRLPTDDVDTHIEAISISALRKDPAFCRETGLIDENSIDLRRFADAISNKLQTEESVVKKLAKLLAEPPFDKITDTPVTIGGEKEAANRLAGLFIEGEFSLVMRLLAKAHAELDPLKEDKARQVLSEICHWFVPASYDRQGSCIMIQAYRDGNTKLIDSLATNDIAAEIRMAAAEGRSAEFSIRREHDGDLKVSGLNKVHPTITYGLGQTKEHQLVTSIVSELFERYGYETTTSNDVEPYIDDLKMSIRESIEDGQPAPYSLIGNDPGKETISRDECLKVADIIKRRLPDIAILMLSRDTEIERRENRELRTFKDLLKKRKKDDAG